MPRGSSFSSVLTFFREGNEDEVRAILPLVIEAAGQRHITITTTQGAGLSTFHQRLRKPAVKMARTSTSRSATAKRAWNTRRLNAAQPEQAAAAGAE